MIYKLDFYLPGLPPTTNGSHGHWRAAAAKRKEWRQASCFVASGNRPPEPLRNAKLTLTRFSSNRPDFDNLTISFKSVVDGLKDAKVIHDDKDSVIIERVYQWEKAPPKKGKIRIQVEDKAA